MSNNNNTGNQGTNTAGQQEERTFTQDDVNRIVAERLARKEKEYEGFEELKQKAAKYDEAEERNKSELQKATERAEALQSRVDAMEKADSIRKIREQIAAETNVPASLLTGETEEDCKTQAAAIASYAAEKNPNYPNVKDGGSKNGKVVTKSDIMSIKDEKARLKAIRENIDLF